jgi:methyl-accepting chemotaxis protein
MFRKWLNRQRTLRATLTALDRAQAIIEFDVDGHVVAANGAFLEVMGYPLHEIVGVHHRLFVDPVEAASVEYAEFWSRLRLGDADAGLYRRLAKGGREVWLQSSYNPIRDRRGRVTGIVKFATDVTARRQAEADMQGRLSALDRSQGVIEFALDGTIIEANRNFLDAMGYEINDIAGRHHRIFVDPVEAASDEYRAFWARLRDGEHHAAVYRRLGRGGREVWIQATYNPILDTSGRPVRIVKYATDITAQTAAAQTLQREVVALSAAVMGSAREAARADIMSDGARRSARDGGQVVQDVVRTMETIQGKTRAMEDVLELIDTLAFQTNLLSLNASIEAARAGASGKAFAVVAEEVRQLAQRSAEASRQIHALIGEARSSVDEGAELVGAAGHAMQQILGAVEAMTDVTTAIGDSAQAQSSGIERVNEAVEELDRVYGLGSGDVVPANDPVAVEPLRDAACAA